MADTDILYIPGFGAVEDIVGPENNYGTINGTVTNIVLVQDDTFGYTEYIAAGY
jgi:hypothetical protein